MRYVVLFSKLSVIIALLGPDNNIWVHVLSLRKSYRARGITSYSTPTHHIVCSCMLGAQQHDFREISRPEFESRAQNVRMRT